MFSSVQNLMFMCSVFLLSPVTSASLQQLSGLDLLKVLLQVEQPLANDFNSHNQSWWKPENTDVYLLEHPHFKHRTLDRESNKNGGINSWKRSGLESEGPDQYFDDSIQMRKKAHSWTEPIVLLKRQYHDFDELGEWQVEDERNAGYEPPSRNEEQRLDFWAKLLHDDEWPLQQSTFQETALNKWTEPIVTRNWKRSGKVFKTSGGRRRKLKGKGHHEHQKSHKAEESEELTANDGQQWYEEDRPTTPGQLSVPQLECSLSEEGLERYACPSPDRYGRFFCIDDHMLCDGYRACPGGEDENRRNCMFYRTTKIHLNVLADALLRWIRGR